MTSRQILLSGIIFMLCAVALGAFGAHVVEPRVSAHHLQTWKTAAQYQSYHALGLILLAIWSSRMPVNGLVKVAGISFVLGIVLFSGSLYALVLSGNNLLGVITPFGGLALMAGWLSWLIAAIKS